MVKLFVMKSGSAYAWIFVYIFKVAGLVFIEMLK